MGKYKKITRAWNQGEFRKKNNKSVQKSRERKKVHHEQTLTQIKIMKAKNEGLELRIQNLRKQLDSLKEIYYEQQRARTEKVKPAENPIIKKEPLDTEEEEDADDCQIDVEKYDELRQILNEVHILNNS